MREHERAVAESHQKASEAWEALDLGIGFTSNKADREAGMATATLHTGRDFARYIAERKIERNSALGGYRVDDGTVVGTVVLSHYYVSGDGAVSRALTERKAKRKLFGGVRLTMIGTPLYGPPRERVVSRWGPDEAIPDDDLRHLRRAVYQAAYKRAHPSNPDVP